MKLLEYESKSLLSRYGLPIPYGVIIDGLYESDRFPVVLKSQVPTGGRGKAGGIRTVHSVLEAQEAIEVISELSIDGFTPRRILADELIDIQRELYLSVFVDRDSSSIKLMAHNNGGVEIEDNPPGSFLVLSLGDNLNSVLLGEQLAEYYNLPDKSFILADLVDNLYRCFTEQDATLIEINPLILSSANKLIAGDCKMELDDAATFRHPEWDFEDKPTNTNFVTLDLDGLVATIANGAGLAMATVDEVAAAGLRPANFLDIGGGASEESVTAAFRTIVAYPNVQGIIINIFAGITRCDEIAKAIVSARRELPGLPKLYIRLAGTNFAAAKTILEHENISLLSSLEECVGLAQSELTT